MGDARFVLSSLLDSNINSNITYQEVIDYLKRAYKTTSSINFYRASQNFINQCVPRNKSENDFLKLRAIELSCRELLDAFTEREAYTNSQKSTNEKLMELLTLTAFSAFAGEKISKKLTKESVPARELLVRTKEELRLAELKDRQDAIGAGENIFIAENTFTEPVFTPKQPQTNRNKGKNNTYRHPYQGSRNNKVMCHKCGIENHMASQCKTSIELFCKKCYTSLNPNY